MTPLHEITNQCETCAGQAVPGMIVWNGDPDMPIGLVVVERCDSCCVYDTDRDAADAISKEVVSDIHSDRVLCRYEGGAA